MMRCFKIIWLFALLAFFAGFKLDAATIIYKADKDGEKKILTKVKVISISKGVMMLEKDGARKSISLGQLLEYSDSDLKSGGDALEDNSSEYTVTLLKVTMPKTGLVKTGSKQTGAATSCCEIEYAINRKQDDSKDSNRVKVPYFYLHVLTDGNDENGNRDVYRFCYPAAAKPGSDTYDEARILDAVQSFKRNTINFDNLHGLNSTGKQELRSQSDREIKIKLDKIKDRRIVAYHLEVWGKSDKIAEKDWSEIGHIYDKKWWLRHGN